LRWSRRQCDALAVETHVKWAKQAELEHSRWDLAVRASMTRQRHADGKHTPNTRRPPGRNTPRDTISNAGSPKLLACLELPKQEEERPVHQTTEVPRSSRRNALRVIQGAAAIGALLALTPNRAAADDDALMAVVGSWLIRSGPPDGGLVTASRIQLARLESQVSGGEG
jgi:hypothetical protein